MYFGFTTSTIWKHENIDEVITIECIHVFCYIIFTVCLFLGHSETRRWIG